MGCGARRCRDILLQLGQLLGNLGSALLGDHGSIAQPARHGKGNR